MGGPILVSLNRLGTCLEHDPGYDPGYDPFWFSFIANYYILMITDLSLNIDLKICYIVDAIRAHFQDKYLA